VKKLNIILIVTFLIVTFAFVGFVSAADTVSISATGNAFWGTTPSLGAVVNVTINFQSSSSSQLYLYRIGIHTDWQASGYYYSKDYSNDPQVVEANGLYAVTVPISIPVNASVGQHTLMISADGYTSDGNPFSWDSATQTFKVEVTAPTPSSTTNQNGNNTSSSGLNDIILYGAVIAVVVVVAILLAVILMKRKSNKTAAPASYTSAPEPQPVNNPPPQQSPTEQPQDTGSEEPEGKDFNI
jgi:hypothetical protein